MILARRAARLAGVTGACLVVWACSSTTTQAGLEVWVQTDMKPSQYGSIWVQVKQQTAALQWNQMVSEALPSLPARFAIAPGSSSDQEVQIVVAAYAGTGGPGGSDGPALVTRVEQVQVPRTYVAQLDIELSSSPASCPGTWDAATATCTVDLDDAGLLPAYVPDANGFDAGIREAGSRADAKPDVTLTRV